MASVNTIVSQTFIKLPTSTHPLTNYKPFLSLPSSSRIRTGARKTRTLETHAINEEITAIPAQIGDISDQKAGQQVPGQIAGYAFESGISDDGGSGFTSSSDSPVEIGDQVKMADRIINASIVLAAGTFAITKLLTIDRDYWHGWTIYEILRYAPLHNWAAYEEALKTNPVLAKMMISGIVYSMGDWIAQCYAGKPLFDFDRARMFRSGLTGFALHGSLSHYYYEICEYIFPFHSWWIVPAKVAFDQTVWSAIWNSIYFVTLGFLRFESPANIFGELKATFLPMLTAGWKLWPFAHLITYGVIPVEQRLLWVDCIELVWVMILSTYSNEKSEARHSEAILSEISTESEARHSAAPEETTDIK